MAYFPPDFRGRNAEDIPPDRERFDMYWELEESTGCHLWRGLIGKDGYGIFWSRDQRRNVRAARWLLIRETGPMPPGMMACHICDQPICVNLNHLYRGTHSRNMKDRAERGWRPPIKITAAVLKDTEIRRAKGETYKSIAAEYGLHPEALSYKLRKRRT